MKILITGGHFSPAFEVINELKKSHDIMVVGRRYVFEGEKTESFEYILCKKNNIPFVSLKAGRLQRKITKHTIPSLLKFPKAVVDAGRVLSDFRPDVVLSFGGYVSIPVVIAAWKRGIPIIVHEQTLEAGIANKFAGKLAEKVCVSFEESKKYFPGKKVSVTGLPLRRDIFQIQKSIEIEEGPLLYITGGSSGSHFINSLIEQNLNPLLSNFVILHQTGDSELYHDFDRLTSLREGLEDSRRKRYIVRKFVYPDEIGWALSKADIVIARSGANTVQELIALQKKAIFIPLPYGQKNEQLKNAQYAMTKIRCEILEQKNITDDLFLETIEKLHNSKISHQKPQFSDTATKKIVDVIQSVYEKRETKKKE